MKRLIDSGTSLLGSSDEISKLKDLISKVSATSSRVLITGENGTGKELAAKSIHIQSERSSNPFIQVNCATIPKDLIELEMFGCVEGYLAFAPGKRVGKFELANGGTLLLDEISDLSIEAQSKLLNVLNENKIEPLGSSESIPVDIRIISSTNRNIQDLIAEGKFREDLYHRLNVININVPPLRNHKEDIPELIEAFGNEICIKNNIPPKNFTQSAKEYMKSMKWPGNVRELRNTVERLIILSDTDVIDKYNVENESDQYSSELEEIISSTESLRDFQDLSEKIFIEKKLAENNWNISKTAESLDIQRSHLYTKIKQFNIEIPEKEEKKH